MRTGYGKRYTLLDRDMVPGAPDVAGQVSQTGNETAGPFRFQTGEHLLQHRVVSPMRDPEVDYPEPGPRVAFRDVVYEAGQRRTRERNRTGEPRMLRRVAQRNYWAYQRL